MTQTIYKENLFHLLSSCNCSAGYIFIDKHFHIVNQLAVSLCPESSLISKDFDIGFLKWNFLSHSLSIVLQKLNTNSTVPFIKNLLSDIDVLFIDEECKKYSRYYLNEPSDFEIVYVYPTLS